MLLKDFISHLKDANIIQKYTAAEVPEALGFGGRIAAFQFNWHQHSNSNQVNLLMYSDMICDPNLTIYSEDYVHFSQDSQLPVNIESSFYLHNIDSPYNKPLDKETYIDLIRNLLDKAYPLVGFRIYKNISSLKSVGKELFGKEEFKSYEELTTFFDLIYKPGRVIDLSRLACKLDLIDSSDANYIKMAERLPLSKHYSMHPCLESELALEAFNYLVHLGSTEGKFNDFKTLIRFLNDPILIAYMPFGKHEGVPLPKLPKSYVNYLLSQSWMFGVEHSDLMYSLKNMDKIQTLMSE